MIGKLDQKRLTEAVLWSFVFYLVPVIYGHAGPLFLGICVVGTWYRECSLQVKVFVTALAIAGQIVAAGIAYAICSRDDLSFKFLGTFYGLFIFFAGTWVTWTVAMSPKFASIQEVFFK